MVSLLMASAFDPVFLSSCLRYLGLQKGQYDEDWPYTKMKCCFRFAERFPLVTFSVSSTSLWQEAILFC